MLKLRNIQETHAVVDKVICDKCGKEFDVDHDFLEAQEFQYLRFTGGYGSVFGDGSTVTCELCQHCLKSLVGQYCYIDGVKQPKEAPDMEKIL